MPQLVEHPTGECYSPHLLVFVGSATSIPARNLHAVYEETKSPSNMPDLPARTVGISMAWFEERKMIKEKISGHSEGDCASEREG